MNLTKYIIIIIVLMKTEYDFFGAGCNSRPTVTTYVEVRDPRMRWTQCKSGTDSKVWMGEENYCFIY